MLQSKTLKKRPNSCLFTAQKSRLRSLYYIDFRLVYRFLQAGIEDKKFFSTEVMLAIVFLSSMLIVIVIVFAVFFGFQNSIYKTLFTAAPHLRIEHQFTKTFSGYESVLRYVSKELSDQKKNTLLHSIYPELSIPVLLPDFADYEVKNLIALPKEYFLTLIQTSNTISDVRNNNQQVQIQYFRQDALLHFDEKNYILIGSEMAQEYNYALGDQVELLLPKRLQFGQIEDIVQETFIIAGFFKTGFYEFDQGYIYMDLLRAQQLLDVPQDITSIRIQLHNSDDLQNAKKIFIELMLKYDYDLNNGLVATQNEDRLQDTTPSTSTTDHLSTSVEADNNEEEMLLQIPKYSIVTIEDERRNLFEALQLEKTMLLIILSLLVFAGIIGVWISITLLVQSKKYSIGVLKAYGLSITNIMRIFSLAALLMATLSLVFGSIFGIFLSHHLENILLLSEDAINGFCSWFSVNCVPISLIPDNIYYVDHLPISIDLFTLFLIGSLTLLLSSLSGYFAARRILRLETSKILAVE